MATESTLMGLEPSWHRANVVFSRFGLAAGDELIVLAEGEQLTGCKCDQTYVFFFSKRSQLPMNNKDGWRQVSNNVLTAVQVSSMVISA